jgi:hypothetical protein
MGGDGLSTTQGCNYRALANPSFSHNSAAGTRRCFGHFLSPSHLPGPAVSKDVRAFCGGAGPGASIGRVRRPTVGHVLAAIGRQGCRGRRRGPLTA